MKPCECDNYCIMQLNDHEMKCEHLGTKCTNEDGIIGWCNKFNVMVNPTDRENHYCATTINASNTKTKENLCLLANIIAERTHNDSTKRFMKHFLNIDPEAKNFQELCVLFRNGVDVALKLEPYLWYREDIQVLRDAADVEVYGYKLFNDGLTRVCKTSVKKEKCNKCTHREDCSVRKFALTFDFTVVDCGEIICCGRDIIEKFMNELNLYDIHYNERTSGSSEKVANEQAHIFITNPDKDNLITLHKICNEFSSTLDFSTKNAQIEEDGSIGLWIFVKKEIANKPKPCRIRYKNEKAKGN